MNTRVITGNNTPDTEISSRSDLTIPAIRINGSIKPIVLDEAPRISFDLASDLSGEKLRSATISVTAVKDDYLSHDDLPNKVSVDDNPADGESWTTRDQINNLYQGTLKPFTHYCVSVKAVGESGQTASARTHFETGRLGTPWKARWITDASYSFPNKKSPAPMTFRTNFTLRKKTIRSAWVNSTALGIYELSLNGSKVGEDYFAPAHTSYTHQIQYQTYDVSSLLRKNNELVAVVGGGWAVGSFTYRRKSKIYADRQALLCEMHVKYVDGTEDIFASDPSWEVTEGGNYRAAEWYNGEIYDSTINLGAAHWKKADSFQWGKKPAILAQYGESVRAHEVMKPISHFTAPSGEIIYDFGQNFAGVIQARIDGNQGQKIIFHHAEVLVNNELFRKSLRTAKATAIYICSDGLQDYSPRLTYMGFRYVGVTGISPDKLQLSAVALYSDLENNGSFKCSNDMLNRLNENIRWGGKSNFVDIPTDCPQRDERQGWTGDIAVFARTASYNFNMSRFLDKWLLDMKSEQGHGGGIPMVIPRSGDSWPVMATSCWGDSCVLVPWAEYLARGDKTMLKRQYPVMKKFLKAAGWWSSLFSIRPDERKIWKFPFHFGDWTAPGEDFKQWVGKGKWIATAYYANSAGIVAQVANELGKTEEAKKYTQLRAEIIAAFRHVFTDGQGKLDREFQTGYVLPLHFNMTSGTETSHMAKNLVKLVKQDGYHIGTGFTGTPYILFALSDNGYADVAYKVLLQDSCPSWLYEVKTGGTTIWERWDALRPDGTVNIADVNGGKSDEQSDGGMVSFNHYASGAVGDWLYRRVAGIEPTSAGYRSFIVKPIVGGNLTYAKASVRTPYGLVSSSWSIDDGRFNLQVRVPVSATCTVEMPDNSKHSLESGEYRFSCASNYVSTPH